MSVKSISIDFSDWHHQEDTIAQGCLTNSKHPYSHVFGAYPTHAVKYQGCTIYDNKGRRYLDFICGLGTNILGYGNPILSDAVSRAVMFGSAGASPSLPTRYEAQFVEELRTCYPAAERVKILKTGSEACSASVTMARAYTNRSTVLSSGYHGHHSEFTSLTPPAYGCPYSEHIKKFVDLEQITDSTAAVIVEPVLTVCDNEVKQYLSDLREKCTKHGAVLIFDEVITGFRTPQFSMSRYLGVEPDLILFGKAVANGFPLACVAGRADILDGQYFVSSTYGGETTGLIAGIETIKIIRNNRDYDLETLWDKGQQFLNAFNAIDPEIIRIEAYPSRGRFIGSDLNKAIFFQEAARCGFLFGPSWFYNHQLHEYKNEVIGGCKQIIQRIRNKTAKFNCQMPRKPHAMKVRDADERAK